MATVIPTEQSKEINTPSTFTNRTHIIVALCSQTLTTPWSIEFNEKRLQLTTPWSIEFNENVLVLVLGNLLEVLSDQSLKKNC